MSDVIVIQHIQCETLGRIADALDKAGFQAKYVRTFEGQTVPGELGESSGLIIMGGPMGVYEQNRYPHLRREMHLIEKTLQEDKPILGICLGSQLIATALGAKVTKGSKKEIGWYPVVLKKAARTDRLWRGIKSPFVAYHWHGDRFDLPPGAILLASSDLTECQAFRYGRHVYGLLFHMEVTETMVMDMVKTFTDELAGEGIDGNVIARKAKSYLPGLEKAGRLAFSRWVNLMKRNNKQGH